MQSTIIDENIDLTADLSPLISEFYFDEEQIKQALMNIITNSISSIKSTGAVQIKTLQMDSEIILEVSDTGIGMADETLENIFNPFYTTRRDGTGLGLAVTERIVEEHDGRIEVNSKLGEGTVFKIILPVIQEEMLMDQSY